MSSPMALCVASSFFQVSLGLATEARDHNGIGGDMSSAQCFLLSPKDRDLLLKAIIPQNKFILPWSFLLCQCSSDITNQVHTRLCVPDAVLLHCLWCTSGSEFSMAHPRAQVFRTQGPCLQKCFSCYQECVLLLQSGFSGVWKSEARRVLDLWSQLLCWKGWPGETASFSTVECKGTGGWCGVLPVLNLVL